MIRLIELFAGYGSQALALKYLGLPFEHHFVCEFDKYAMQSYNEIHNTNFKCSDIRDIKSEDLNIVETDKYDYLMTYSFPCTDLSLAGKQRGMQRESGTYSSLLWEVERLLCGCESLPQYLLMENVPQVISRENQPIFKEWTDFLSSLGYMNYIKCLNAKDFNVPQNRNRCFMVSILKSCNKIFEFPKPIMLKLKLKDMLEECVDEKYYLSGKQIEAVESWGAYQKPLECMERIDVLNISPTITTRSGAYCAGMILIKTALGIRKLTPKECFRLMGVRDEDSNKLTCSDAQKYKQAGNSIVVDVLMAIFDKLFVNTSTNYLFN